MASLTNRQIETVNALLELYLEEGRSIAYRDVAERLGVAPSTAYRMLRHAEQLGYVRATYARHPDARVGRSSVVFEPTELARETAAAAQPHTPIADDETWQETRTRIIDALNSPDEAAAEEELAELLKNLEEPGTATDVVGRSIATLMINLEESLDEYDEDALLDRTARSGSEMGLSTLGGMLLGLNWANRTTRDVARRVEGQVGSFEESLKGLTSEESRGLSSFASQLSVALRARRNRIEDKTADDE